jgi:RNA polymerase sigma factor (sigma-70 family)
MITGMPELTPLSEEQPLTQHQIDDAETERLLGLPLPEERLVETAYERQLLGRIEQGDQEAKLTYLAARARTIYTVVSKIPEVSGLTIEDYFQVGCMAVMKTAESDEFRTTTIDSAVVLHGAIRGAVRREIRAQRLAPPGIRQVALSEKNVGVEPDRNLERAVGSIERQALRQIIGGVKARNQRDGNVLELLYGLSREEDDEPRTQVAMGRILQITHSRVQQIERRLLRNLNEAIIPLDHLLRLPLVDGVPDRWEAYAARQAQAEAAGMVQKQRDRRATEESLLANYPGDPEDATRQERLIGGLAVAVMNVLRVRQSQQPGSVERYDYRYLLDSLVTAIEYGYTINHNEFTRSLNFLSDAGFITWIQPEGSHSSFVKLTH